MNIFFLDGDPKTCAQSHCSKHVVKMIVEYAQILSSAHHRAPNKANKEWMFICYQMPKGMNPHPLNWVMESLDNYKWLSQLSLELIKEYKFRYFNRTHKTEVTLDWLSTSYPSIPSNGITNPQVLSIGNTQRYDPEMSELQYLDTKNEVNRKLLRTIILYRRFYKEDKKAFAVWGNRPTPVWFQ
jgi:hypothetical protein